MFVFLATTTVKFVLSGHSKIDKTNMLLINGKHEMQALMAYTSILSLNMRTQLSSGAKCIKFCNLLPCNR